MRAGAGPARRDESIRPGLRAEVPVDIQQAPQAVPPARKAAAPLLRLRLLTQLLAQAELGVDQVQGEVLLRRQVRQRGEEVFGAARLAGPQPPAQLRAGPPQLLRGGLIGRRGGKHAKASRWLTKGNAGILSRRPPAQQRFFGLGGCPRYRLCPRRVGIRLRGGATTSSADTVRWWNRSTTLRRSWRGRGRATTTP